MNGRAGAIARADSRPFPAAREASFLSIKLHSGIVEGYIALPCKDGNARLRLNFEPAITLNEHIGSVGINADAVVVCAYVVIAYELDGHTCLQADSARAVIANDGSVVERKRIGSRIVAHLALCHAVREVVPVIISKSYSADAGGTFRVVFRHDFDTAIDRSVVRVELAILEVGSFGRVDEAFVHVEIFHAYDGLAIAGVQGEKCGSVHIDASLSCTVDGRLCVNYYRGGVLKCQIALNGQSAVVAVEGERAGTVDVCFVLYGERLFQLHGVVAHKTDGDALGLSLRGTDMGVVKGEDPLSRIVGDGARGHPFAKVPVVFRGHGDAIHREGEGHVVGALLERSPDTILIDVFRAFRYQYVVWHASKSVFPRRRHFLPIEPLQLQVASGIADFLTIPDARLFHAPHAGRDGEL